MKKLLCLCLVLLLSASLSMAARSVIATQTVSRSGLIIGTGGTSTTCDPGNDHYFANTGSEILVVQNTSGAATRDIDIITGATVDGLAIPDITETIAISGIEAFGPFPETIYDQTSGTEKGSIHVDCDSADIKFQVITFTPVTN